MFKLDKTPRKTYLLVISFEKENVMAEETVVLQQSVRKACPKCGKLFKPTGLSGHLRFIHGVSGDAARKLWDKSPVDAASMYDGAFDVIEDIEALRERKQLVEQKYASFFTTEQLQQALSALDEQEKRLTAELESLKGEQQELQQEHVEQGLELEPVKQRKRGKPQVLRNDLVEFCVNTDGTFVMRLLQDSVPGQRHDLTKDGDGKWQLESFDPLGERQRRPAQEQPAQNNSTLLSRLGFRVR
jgi:hypothetical protein